MKEPYERPEVNIIMFLASQPIASEEEDAEVSHDNGYVDWWSMDSSESDLEESL